jgi:predicted DNA-binding antitoxin AbrB/MazE fold protein
MPKVVEAIYEDGVLKPLKKLNLKEKSRVLIKIIDRDELDELLNSMVIEKIDNIDYRKLKEAYYESI